MEPSKSSDIKIIAICGGSGSGKSTAANKLRIIIGEEKCKVITQDSYYKDQSHKFKGDGSVNFDHPNAIDFDLLSFHLNELIQLRSIQVPIYDFVTHSRKNEIQLVTPARVVILDGTLLLVQEQIRKFLDISIFINISEEIRFARRLKRDIEERGRELEGIKTQFYSCVKPMHDIFVQPSSCYATHIVNDDDALNKCLFEIGSCLIT